MRSTDRALRRLGADARCTAQCVASMRAGDGDSDDGRSSTAGLKKAEPGAVYHAFTLESLVVKEPMLGAGIEDDLLDTPGTRAAAHRTGSALAALSSPHAHSHPRVAQTPAERKRHIASRRRERPLACLAHRRRASPTLASGTSQ